MRETARSLYLIGTSRRGTGMHGDKSYPYKNLQGGWMRLGRGVAGPSSDGVGDGGRDGKRHGDNGEAVGRRAGGCGDGGGKDGGGEQADVYVPDRGRLPALLLAPHERRSRAQAGAGRRGAGGGYRGARWQARRERCDRAGR
eukprot:CAMPEP_0202767046 /NCGR_PEP_ID=MMETSP1388-20130828/31872_1 /ASSEMBLY_ACC=CAM_ASM_000864 /TAXON_ID=37098 /ORGANISM="Isochrysis sp, Strain CCMP1244" /LENGTH=141 /DNA_ID=CAMNT_0049435713 /DNA_START=440 /DNA_END=862 /DNA_ORIENTATION=-